jgi:cell division protein FtsL
LRGEYVVRRQVDNSFLVRQRDRRRRRELAAVFLALVPVAGGMLGYVWLNLRLVHIGYEVDRLERTLKLEERRERELWVEAAYLSSPERIREEAGGKLGLVEADLDRMVFVEDTP